MVNNIEYSSAHIRELFLEIKIKDWNGFVHGTNTGKLNFNFSEMGANPKGKLRFLDDQFGLVLYDISGQVLDDSIKFSGKPTLQRDDLAQGDIEIICNLTAEGNLRGNWSSTIGTGGTFMAYPFGANVDQSPALQVPEQIFIKRISLGFMQVYKNHIIEIAEFMKKEFPNKDIIVTYQAKDKPERINYFRDFIKTTDVSTLDYLKLFVSEPELGGKGINKSISIELRSHGSNDLIVQGMYESWVLGQAQIAFNFLSQYVDKIRSTVHKFLAPLQLAILLIMIIIMTTEENIVSKTWLAIITFFILYIIPKLFMRFFPNAIVQVGEAKLSAFKKLIFTGGNWIAGFALIVTTVLVQNYASRVAQAIQAFLDAFLSG